MTARDLLVTGRVQGVFFRAACREQARALELNGWVRNEPDGSVRVHVDGDREAVEALVEWLHQGPRGARVKRVEDVAGAARDAESTAKGFEVR